MTNVELPAAIARKRRERNYPLVPLFATTRPQEARRLLLDEVAQDGTGKLAGTDVELFIDANGYVRERRQRRAEMHTAVAKLYVRSAVEWLEREAYDVSVTALAEPDGSHDFTFDWRHLLDDRTRALEDGAAQELCDGLSAFRDAVKARGGFPHLTLDLDLPLPLAALTGYEWRVTSRLKLTIRQRTRSTITVVDGDGVVSQDFPNWTETTLGGPGPVVIAVSTMARPLTRLLARYASGFQARKTMDLHVPEELDARRVRGLARHIADALRDASLMGAQKHLLLAGPVSLAVLVGASANGAGAVTMPLWDGRTYGQPLVIGG